MRVNELTAVTTKRREINNKAQYAGGIRKLTWPDLVFAPVNLWSLPSASFFYRNHQSREKMPDKKRIN